MKGLKVIKAKPNPSGKDRTLHQIPPKQLAAEWVDFQNIGNEGYNLAPVTLQHLVYKPGCSDARAEIVMTFKGTLQPGEILRVHSGHPIPLTDLPQEDVAEATYHLFSGKGYVWNNSCGDAPSLAEGGAWIDRAFYDSNPPEGRILVRSGDKLV